MTATVVISTNINCDNMYSLLHQTPGTTDSTEIHQLPVTGLLEHILYWQHECDVIYSWSDDWQFNVCNEKLDSHQCGSSRTTQPLLQWASTLLSVNIGKCHNHFKSICWHDKHLLRSYIFTSSTAWLVAWHSARMSVFDGQTFAVLRSTCSWQVTTYVGKPSAVGQQTRLTQPFILSG